MVSFPPDGDSEKARKLGDRIIRDAAEYNPEDDAGFGDRHPEDRTPPRLQERVGRIQDQLDGLVENVRQLLAHISGPVHDPDVFVSRASVLQTLVTRQASGLGFVMTAVAKDIATTAKETGNKSPHVPVCAGREGPFPAA